MSDHRAERPHGSGRPRGTAGPGYSRDARTGRAPRGGRPPSDPARQAAYEAIAAVHRDDAYANLVLADILRSMALSGRDAAFATELTYGTLRALGTLDLIIAAAAGRDMARIDPPARDALRLGAYQLLYTRVPAHAAVNQTVDLVRSVATGATGFANAVLRTITETPLDGWLEQLAPAYDVDPVGNLAVLHNHPQWIVRAFAESLGGDLEETARLLIEDNQAPIVHLCARPGRADAVELADEVDGVPAAFSPYAVYLNGGSPRELAAIAEGRAHVQDEGSQLVAAALLAGPVEGRDTRWLDLCAGPGGKAGLLGSIAALRGAEVTAVEVQEHRARLVEHATEGMPVTVLPMDGIPICRRSRSTGCWSTRRAPGWARCGGGRSRAGGGSRPTCRR
jgi:16S rRNA (cytosine967-C5)-methyltransferase